MNKKVVLVLGMHRSGTSAVAKGIVELGAHPGENLMPENEENPKGYWEDISIAKLNEKILKDFNMRWHSLDDPRLNRFATLLPLYEEKYLPEAMEIVNNIFSYSKTIMIKDPRISVLLPFWKKVFHQIGAEVKCVLAIRNPLETAKSLQKRNGMEIDEGVKLWSYYNFMALKNMDDDFLVCSFSSLLNHSIQELERISRHIKRSTTEVDLEEYSSHFLEKSLKHYNDDATELKKYLGEEHPSFILYEQLNKWSKSNSAPLKETHDMTHHYLESYSHSIGYEGEDLIDDFTQIFVNTGQGYSEEESFKYSITSSGVNAVELDLASSDHVNEIRIDPSNNRCVVLIHSVEILNNEKQISFEFCGHNAQYHFNNVYIFEEEDPQIKLKPENVNFNEMKIRFSIYPFDSHVLSFIEALKNQRYHDLSNKVKQLEKEIDIKEKKIAEKSHMLEQGELRIKKSSQEINEKEKEINDLQDQLKTEEQKMKSKELELNKLFQEIEEIKKQNNIIKEELSEKKRLIEVKDDKEAQLEQQIKIKENEITALQSSLEENENEIITLQDRIEERNNNIKSKESQLISLEKKMESFQAELADFLERMNEREIRRYRRVFQYISIVLQNSLSFLVHPIKRIKLLRDKQVLQNAKAFNKMYYLYKNKELIGKNINLLEHFLEYGWKEGKSPNSSVNIKPYLESTLKDRIIDENPYIKKLKEEQKIYKVLRKSKYFDCDYYRALYNDIAKKDADPIQHYIKYGYKEGRNPSEHFDTRFYINTNRDVREEGVNPLYHYLLKGQYEGRLPYDGFAPDNTPFYQFMQKIKKLIIYKQSK